MSLSTKSIHPLLISQFSDSSRSIKNEKVIQKFKLEASEPAQSLSKNANSLLSKIVKNSKILLSSTSLSTTQSTQSENVDILSVNNNISKWVRDFLKYKYKSDWIKQQRIRVFFT